ncbi:unnamed protein product [Brachionus calyciflorus]|uniref:Transmembrane protein 230 n=1 Tax=Brachionus calyciflorus TaxID=104777 RepID=A0A814BJJ7_9BILA|nr:unnamed protein product [Brachionus calyciflorus]
MKNLIEDIMPTKDATDMKYSRLNESHQFTDLQFKTREPKVPIKAILTAFFMFISGSCMIIIGALLYTGHIDAQYSDRMWPLFILGSLLFLPGFYHVRIAYYAWRKYEGFSFDDIPTDD